MAFKKTLIQRLFEMPKMSNSFIKNCRISSSIPPERVAPDPGDHKNNGFFRFLHKNAIFNPTPTRTLPVGDMLMERLREMDIVKDRIKLDGLIPPPQPERPDPDTTRLSISDAKKLLKVAQLEGVKTRLRQSEKSWITYSEFLRICGEGCSDPEQGTGFAKALDQSGNVIVLGDIVYLRPEQEK